MQKENIIKHLEGIYIDYYDGLYSESQLKFMLNKLYKQSSLDIEEWSEEILDAQWKYATDVDYVKKKQQLEDDENHI